jgi:NAD+ synthase
VKTTDAKISPDVLTIDPEQTTLVIENALRQQVQGFRRRGAVVGLSGGIDSSVVTALCTRAFGRSC